MSNPHKWPAAFDIGDQHFVVDDLVNQAAQAAMRRHAAINDRVLRQLLGQWVSELEPVIFVRQDDGLIVGIGAEGHHKPTIHNPHAYPIRDFMLRGIF
jgi:hypothetical protein